MKKTSFYASFAALAMLALPVVSTAQDKEKPVKAPAAAKATEVTHVKAAEAKKLLDDASQGIVVLDVRTPQEHGEGKIAGSKNVDFKAADFKAQVAKLDKTKPYLVHCRSGGRSTSSLAIFKELGFSKIIHLDGGFEGWKQEKLPVAK